MLMHAFLGQMNTALSQHKYVYHHYA